MSKRASGRKAKASLKAAKDENQGRREEWREGEVSSYIGAYCP